jgi:hypothetical protein
MSKRAPALGRQVKPGPITHLATRREESWNGMRGPWCRCGDFPMERMPPGTAVMPTRTIHLPAAFTEDAEGNTVPVVNRLPRPVAWRYLDWTVSADGYRLVIEHGVMIGLAYDEDPWPWGDPRWLTSHLIADHEIRAALYWPHHTCDERCVCPRHGTPMIYWPRGGDHACQDADCMYGRGVRVAIGAELPSVTCPRCGMTSRNSDDVDHGYCGQCHDWTSAR